MQGEYAVRKAYTAYIYINCTYETNIQTQQNLENKDSNKLANTSCGFLVHN